jgi:hypothetical protein
MTPGKIEDWSSWRQWIRCRCSRLATLQGLGLEEHLDRAIRFRLTQILGSPFAPVAKPKKPARRMVKPPIVSQSTWDEMLAVRTADRRRREKIRRAARIAA